MNTEKHSYWLYLSALICVPSLLCIFMAHITFFVAHNWFAKSFDKLVKFRHDAYVEFCKL